MRIFSIHRQQLQMSPSFNNLPILDTSAIHKNNDQSQTQARSHDQIGMFRQMSKAVRYEDHRATLPCFSEV